MNTDQIIGVVMAFVAFVVIALESFFLLIQPIANEDTLKDFPAAQYWGLAIPLFLGVFGVLAIVMWIGITMARTPPPEAWDFESLEEEFEEDEDEE